MIDDVVAFLEGRTAEVRQRLRQRMEQAAERLEFERAAELRNALRWLEQVETPPVVETVGGGDADAIGYARDGDDAVGVVVRIRDGKVLGRDQAFLHNLAEEPDAVVLTTYLVRSYVPATGRARRAVLPFAPDDMGAVEALVPEAEFLVPQRGANSRFVHLADQNARHLLESFKIESFEADERAEDPVYALGRDLGLTVVPRSFVCVDISTSQGRDTVGSLVWFEAGRPRKAEYRRFRIKGDPEAPPRDYQQDDFAAVHEVVTRYVTRRRDEGKQLPDLMVIDGGKGQLNAARTALAAAGVSVPLVSLAKRDEEVYLPDRSDPLRLPRSAPSLRLLQRARDEAHRFAVTYNRKRRAARTVTSELLNIPGIGAARRRILLERFGSLAGVKSATVAEIAGVPGFSSRLAERILNHLKT
jgi:excinuclease ABC subunit C